MRSAYLSTYPAATPPRQQTQHWGEELARRQAIYEELLASRELATFQARARSLSAREMTRDLAGWSIPPADTLRALGSY